MRLFDQLDRLLDRGRRLAGRPLQSGEAFPPLDPPVGERLFRGLALEQRLAILAAQCLERRPHPIALAPRRGAMLDDLLSRGERRSEREAFFCGQQLGEALPQRFLPRCFGGNSALREIPRRPRVEHGLAGGEKFDQPAGLRHFGATETARQRRPAVQRIPMGPARHCQPWFGAEDLLVECGDQALLLGDARKPPALLVAAISEAVGLANGAFERRRKTEGPGIGGGLGSERLAFEFAAPDQRPAEIAMGASREDGRRVGNGFSLALAQEPLRRFLALVAQPRGLAFRLGERARRRIESGGGAVDHPPGRRHDRRERFQPAIP
jgi:hypothetical protein